MSEQQVWIGIDTGGTFTDVVLFDRGRERFHYLKLATSTEAPWRAIVDGVDQLLDELRLPPAAVRRLAHGTTLGTNALLEGRLPRTGMITTAGFRDVLELARQRRPHMFNLHVQKPDTIAAREDRLEVRERLDETGGVLEPLDHEQLLACAIRLREQGCTALAVCFLHSYANPAHERRARELIESNWPEVYVSVSHEVLAEMREYERFCTTVVNAALRPIMDGYLSKLEQQLANLGLNVVPGIMQSNGGTVTPASVRRLPVNTCVSGPAAGVVAAQRLGQRMAAPDLLTFDMGGTST
ncbi:MAG: hydantoinase/oxoprolinase family protein, partial [Gammaproteobacteria bacterium]|nr:hydantoinase/oxoprolinase family protein [Gammaproteobacteria bacterium]